MFYKMYYCKFLPTSNLPSFQVENYLFYPDILKQILSFFHAPPTTIGKTHIDNSYAAWFYRFARDKQGNLAHWHRSFYGTHLAVSLNGLCIEATGPFRTNPRIIQTATKSIATTIKIVKRRYGYDGLLEQYQDTIPPMLLCREDTLLIILKSDAGILNFASKEVLNSKSFALNAAKISFKSYRYIPRELRYDKEVRNAYKRRLIKDLFKTPANLGTKIAKSFRDDRDVVLAAVNQDGMTLQYASARRRDDKEIVLTAVTENPDAIAYASASLQEDDDALISCIDWT